MENICASAEFPLMVFPASLRTWTIRERTAKTSVSAYKTSTMAWTFIMNSSSRWRESNDCQLERGVKDDPRTTSWEQQLVCSAPWVIRCLHARKHLRSCRQVG